MTPGRMTGRHAQIQEELADRAYQYIMVDVNPDWDYMAAIVSLPEDRVLAGIACRHLLDGEELRVDHLFSASTQRRQGLATSLLRMAIDTELYEPPAMVRLAPSAYVEYYQNLGFTEQRPGRTSSLWQATPATIRGNMDRRASRAQ